MLKNVQNSIDLDKHDTIHDKRENKAHCIGVHLQKIAYC